MKTWKQIKEQEERDLLRVCTVEGPLFWSRGDFAGSIPLAPGLPKTCTWFLPAFSHSQKGGIRTIFEFAAHLSTTKGTHNIFVICDINSRIKDQERTDQDIKNNFPGLDYEIVLIKELSEVPDLPASDIAICTLWTTAYFLLKYPQTKKKFYFVQDFEPLFYPAGAIYGLIEATYRFGFHGICNSQGIHDRYKQYGNISTAFVPAIDQDIYHPRGRRTAGPPHQVVFYGRPDNSRNAFLLGLETLRLVKKRLGDAVRIVSVGAEWEPRKYKADSYLENLGLLKTLDEVAALYRASDMGLVFMMTPHPSYQPLEFMACGTVTVTNINDGTNWLFDGAEKAIREEPIPTLLSNKIYHVLNDEARMGRIRENGYEMVKNLNWGEVYADLSNFLTSS